MPDGSGSSDQSDVFQSDECDEKRSYTPQPRQITMLGGPKTQGSKLNRGGLPMPTGTIAGGGASQMINRSVVYGAGGGNSGPIAT